MKKSDVLDFAKNFEENLFKLRSDLVSGRYAHDGYKSFFVCDPKRRHIHKASVRDRVLHHVIHRVLYPIFDKSFIFDSYSSRKGKGTHKAIERFRKFAWKSSQNNTKTVWILKCDIRKFFDSVDQKILLSIIKNRIKDSLNYETIIPGCHCEGRSNLYDDFMRLPRFARNDRTEFRNSRKDHKLLDIIEKIIFSFKTENNKGIPLGNLTSQLFSNIYLNELDQFIKRNLRVEYYVRYADDFVILSGDKAYLEKLIGEIGKFLAENLHLQLHPQKIIIGKYHKGIDFLGYVNFPHYKILRTKTKKRVIGKIFKKRNDLKKDLISETHFRQSLESYFGMLKHCRGHEIKKKIDAIIYVE